MSLEVDLFVQWWDCRWDPSIQNQQNGMFFAAQNGMLVFKPKFYKFSQSPATNKMLKVQWIARNISFESTWGKLSYIIFNGLFFGPSHRPTLPLPEWTSREATRRAAGCISYTTLWQGPFESKTFQCFNSRKNLPTHYTQPKTTSKRN